ncbi:hypothetical protein GYB70_29300 [Sinorhizobium meliloti]|nr:hypothetical protein [Sinorhizobium meliloti]
MASEVRLVDSNMVTAGGVTAAKRPQAFKNFLGGRTLFPKLFQLLTLRLAAVILLTNGVIAGDRNTVSTSKIAKTPKDSATPLASSTGSTAIRAPIAWSVAVAMT